MTDSDSYLFLELKNFWSFPLERFIKNWIWYTSEIPSKYPLEIELPVTSGHFVNIKYIFFGVDK